MSDFTNYLHRFKVFYVPNQIPIEKDILKEEAFAKYSKGVSLALWVPVLLQGYQLTLVNKPELVTKLNRIRQLKWLSALGATAFGLFHTFELDKRWEYLDRIYPEKTEYQKNLSREAELYKLRGEQEEKKQFSTAETDVYKRMYSLGKHRSSKPVPDFIPTDFRPDDE